MTDDKRTYISENEENSAALAETPAENKQNGEVNPAANENGAADGGGTEGAVLSAEGGDGADGASPDVWVDEDGTVYEAQDLPDEVEEGDFFAPEKPAPNPGPPPKRAPVGRSLVWGTVMLCIFCSLIAGTIGVLIGLRMTNRTLTFDAVVRRLEANSPDFAAEPQIAQAAASCRQASVTILAGPDEETVGAFSSGIILSREEDGTAYILCCTHAVEHFPVLSVCTWDNYKLPATVVGMDWESDVTLLRVHTAGLDLRVAEPTLRTPVLGETVLVLGNPLGASGISLSVGFVSMPDCQISVNHIPQTLVKLDCAVNHGNSGGGVYDAEGYLIGMVSAKVSELDGRAVEGAAFAVPIDRLYAAAQKLKQYGYIPGQEILGLSTEASASADSPIGITGYLYPSELENEGAEYIPQAGDLIAAYRKGEDLFFYFRANGVSYAEALYRLRGAVASCEAGDTVTLIIQRGTQVFSLPLPVRSATQYGDV